MNVEKMQAWTRINEGRFVAYWLGDNTGKQAAYSVEGFASWEDAQKRRQEIEQKLYENGFRMSAMQDGYHLFQKAA